MDIITKLNWVDILVVIIMLRTSYVAFQDGLSHQVFPLLGSFLGLALSLHYYNKIASLLSQAFGGISPDILKFIGFVAVFAAAAIIFKIIEALFEKIVKITWHPLIEKFAGLLAGVVKALMITSAILIALELLPLSYIKWSIRERSLTGIYFLETGPNVYSKISRFLPPANKPNSSHPAK